MSFGATIGVISCALIGAALFFYGLYQRRKLRESQGWPHVAGTVAKFGMVVHTDADSTTRYVEVLYDYVVTGVRYSGKRIGFRPHTYVRKKKLEEQLARYPVGGTVPVFYNPRDPKDAVLVRESPDSSLLIILGLGLLALAVAIPVLS